MTLTPLAAAIFTPLYLLENGISWGLVLFFVITYTISNITITTGYHRLFAHRSFQAHRAVELFVIFIGAGAFQGSLLQWCADHRVHHHKVDTDEDPYSINKGFWYAHFWWLFRESKYVRDYPKDLTKDRMIMFQHKYYPIVATVMGFFVPGLVGLACGFGFWGGLIIGGALRIVLTQHSTFLVNSAAHTIGRQPYTDKNTARDSFIVAFLTMGEGYHNFHHYFQADYRNAIRWYEWDPTKWLINTLKWVGLADRLKRTRNEDILKARLQMDQRFMQEEGMSSERLEKLKTHLIEGQKRIRLLRESYRAAKKDITIRSQNWKRQFRHDIRAAKTEFRAAYRQWRTLRRQVKRAAA